MNRFWRWGDVDEDLLLFKKLVESPAGDQY